MTHSLTKPHRPRLNRSHPLVKQLKGAFLFPHENYAHNAVGPDGTLAGGTFSTRSTPLGDGIQWETSNPYINTGVYQTDLMGADNTQGCTILSVSGTADLDAGNASVFGCTDGTDDIRLMCRQTAGQHRLELGTGSRSGTPDTAGTNTPLVVVSLVEVLSSTTALAHLWFDGVDQGQSGTCTFTARDTYPFFINAHNISGTPAAGQYFMDSANPGGTIVGILFFTGMLPEAWVRSLSIDPWQMFRPRHAIIRQPYTLSEQPYALPEGA